MALTTEAQAAVDVLRALTVSHKNPARIRDLLREYREMEGTMLPFKRFGFQTAEEFLRSTGEFCLTTSQGEVNVSARPSADSRHITQMIARQKNPKRRAPPLRTPIKSDQSWNKSSYSTNVYRKMSSAPIRRSFNNYSSRPIVSSSSNYTQFRGPSGPTKIYGGDSNNNMNNSSNRNVTMVPSNSNSNTQTPPPLMTVEVKIDCCDLRDRLNAKKGCVEPPKMMQHQNSLQLPQSRAILGQNNTSAGIKKDPLSFTEFLNKKQNLNVESNVQQPQPQTIYQNKNNDNRPVETFDQYLQDRQHLLKQKHDENRKYQPSNIAQPKCHNVFERVSVQGRLNIKNNVNNTAPPTNIPTESDLPAVSIPKIEIKQEVSNNSESVPSSPTPIAPATPTTPTAPTTPKNSTTTPTTQNNLTTPRAPTAADSTSGTSSLSNSPNNSIADNSIKQFSVIDKNSMQTKDINVVPKLIKKEFEFNPNANAVSTLAEYCEARELQAPIYEMLKMKFGGNRIQCRVSVNNIMYSTYPDEYDDVESAKEASAKIAIDEIQSSEQKRQVPVCMDSDCELSMKMYQELKINYPRGIFAKNFPDIFESTFGESLPDHWFSIIQDSNNFVLETMAGDIPIIFANTEASESSIKLGEPDSMIFKNITLPWEHKYWNVYITHCVSTTEIWGRIVDKQYSEQLDTLLNDIDMAMLTDKKRPVSIAVGQIYLVCIAECWHRVRLEKIDKGAGKCMCVFVDFGDDDWVPSDQLYVCEMKFLHLPAQAIPFSLFGLEDFAENPIAKRHIEMMLRGKSLVAEILTKKESYENKSLDETDDCVIKIEIVLYDTSSNEDINLNPLLLNRICDETPPPELKRTGVTNVNITHVNNEGEVYVQVRTLGLAYVEKLIFQLVQSKFKENQHRVTFDDLKITNLFLIKDIECKKWVRGCLLNNDFKIGDENYKIFYVDHGDVKNIHVSQIFRLESLSTALNKFPRQAIKTKLHNLPPMNSSIVARIKGLMRVNYPAIVKLALLSLDKCKNVIPQITAYVRFERNDSLCNVNEAIRMEYELERDNENSSEMPVDSFTSEMYTPPSSPLPPPSPQTTHPSNVLSEMTACIRNVTIRSPTTIQRELANEPLPKISENRWIPDVGQVFNVLVILTSNPYNFLIQSYNDYPEYQDMMLNLQDYCKNTKEYIPGDMIKVGEAYAALRGDGNYYRAVIEQILPTEMSCVCFCDSGEAAVVNNSALKILPLKFRKMPKQVIHAKLHGVRPVNGEWSSEDSIRFRELTLSHKFASVVKNITIDTFLKENPKVLELSLIDVSTPNDIYIHQILIDEKRAIPSS